MLHFCGTAFLFTVWVGATFSFVNSMVSLSLSYQLLVSTDKRGHVVDQRKMYYRDFTTILHAFYRRRFRPKEL